MMSRPALPQWPDTSADNPADGRARAASPRARYVDSAVQFSVGHDLFAGATPRRPIAHGVPASRKRALETEPALRPAVPVNETPREMEAHSLLRRIRAQSLYGVACPARRRFRTLTYESTVPNRFVRIREEGAPDVYFRRFTADGKYLIAFSRSFREVLVFRVESGAARTSCSLDAEEERIIDSEVMPGENELLHAHENSAHSCSEDLGQQQQQHPKSQTLTPSMPFSRFFTLAASVVVPSGNEILCKDFCLITSDDRYAVLGSWAPPLETGDLSGETSSEDAAALTQMPRLESISLHLLDLHSMKVTDTYTFRDDFVLLEAHEGVDLMDNMLMVLSLRHQELHFVEIRSVTGTLRRVFSIGQNCFDDDQLLLREREELERRFTSSKGQPRAPRRDRSQAPDGSTQDSRASSDGGILGDGEYENDTDYFARISHAPAVIVDDRTGFGLGEGGQMRRESAEDAANPRTTGARALHLNRPALAGRGRLQPLLPTMNVVVGRGLGNGLQQGGFFSGLMHKFLVYVWKQHVALGTRSHFFLAFKSFCFLVMLKAQILDTRHILIRLGHLESIRSQTYAQGANQHRLFLVVYNHVEARIVGVFENSSEELLNLLARYSDFFSRGSPSLSLRSELHGIGQRGVGAPSQRTDASGSEPGSASSPALSSNGRARSGGGRGSASGQATIGVEPGRARSVLNMLPVSPQVKHHSVYLDRSMFSYDDRRSSALEGAKAQVFSESSAIKFVARRHHRLAFRVHIGAESAAEPSSARFVGPPYSAAAGSGEAAVPGTQGAATRQAAAATARGGAHGAGAAAAGSGARNTNRRCSALLLFHPVYPFVLGIEMTASATQRLTIHFRVT
ncbi:Light-mediated development protein DET1 [Porphyridium purpureum]|uniref:Light-mediated development protein DET1 n=1 Tax=Porphyridium purpureum TaxID=35688 RepID=A0A5J4Z6L5_PORPP|nr:Light-mediated development protein DET1 [Porphyridium purpureum]|eukprot:POR9365..scf295_1